MSWRPARSIDTLLAEVNAAAPGRSKRSDGTIGDPAHAARVSDHNPNSAGVVTAVDITHDPSNGCDAGDLAERFRTLGNGGDPRIKYVIWNRQIYNPSKSPGWRTYTGSNPHTAHVHLSVSATAAHYDSTAGWGITATGASLEATMFCNLGDTGEAVLHLQLQLRELGHDIDTDGKYGPQTSGALLAARTEAGATQVTSGDEFGARAKIQVDRLICGVRQRQLERRVDGLQDGHTRQHTRLKALEDAEPGEGVKPDGYFPLTVTVLAAPPVEGA